MMMIGCCRYFDVESAVRRLLSCRVGIASGKVFALVVLRLLADL